MVVCVNIKNSNTLSTRFAKKRKKNKKMLIIIIGT